MSKQEKNEKNEQPRFDELIPLRRAAEISGFTQEHLANLIRTGELWGDKLGGRNWFTTEKALREYMAQNKRPGPKPKK